MRELLRALLTVVLCIALMPGWVEALENAEHLVHDGHLAHSGDREAHDDDEGTAAHDALEAEHGCTPMSHSCGCHVSVPVILADALALESRSTLLEEVDPPEHRVRMVHRANAPPVRTPIA
ncbi:MAG: hypothetical protein R3F61_30855 [Myxococcota bacterium]